MTINYSSFSFFCVLVITSLVLLFGASGVESYDNLRPCSLLNETNVLGNYTTFTTICLNQNETASDCDEAWDLFSSVLADTSIIGQQQYGVYADYTSFIYYFDWTAEMKSANRTPMFYANAGQCPDIVHRVSGTPGVREITLEDQSGVKSVANHAWCDISDFNPTLGTCSNTTVWGSDPNYNCSSCRYNGAAFYIPASDWFAQSSFGIATVMLRSYTTGTSYVAAYVPTSVFAATELPALMLNPEVTGLNIIIVSSSLVPNETCGSGSVLQLQQNVSNSAAGWGAPGCVVDPPCVLNIMCTQELTPPVTIENNATKCAYFFTLSADLTTSCECSTQYFDNGHVAGDLDCPGVAEFAKGSGGRLFPIGTLIGAIILGLMLSVM